MRPNFCFYHSMIRKSFATRLLEASAKKADVGFNSCCYRYTSVLYYYLIKGDFYQFIQEKMTVNEGGFYVTTNHYPPRRTTGR